MAKYIKTEDGYKRLEDVAGQLNLATTKDWRQNDPSAPDYIENRPFYAEPLAETVLAEFDFEGEGSIQFLGIEKNKTYMLSIGDNQYVSVCKQHTMEGLTGLYIGNPNILDPTLDNTGEPYLLFEIPDMMTEIMTTGNAIRSGDHIKIEECIAHKIPSVYLPKTNWKDLDGIPFGTEYSVDFNPVAALLSGAYAVDVNGTYVVRVGDYMEKDDFDESIISFVGNGTVAFSGECKYMGLVQSFGEHSYKFLYGEGMQVAFSLYSQDDCDLLGPNLIPGLYLMYAPDNNVYFKLSKALIKNLGKYIDYFTIPNSPVGTISDVFNVPSSEDNIFGESIDATYTNGDTAIFYWVLPETYTKEKLAGSTLVFKDGTTRIVTSTDYEYLVDPQGAQRSEFCKIADIFIWINTLYTEELYDAAGNVFVAIYPGLYVKEMDNPLAEIRFPDEIRKLDLKYLPDEIPTAESVNFADEQTLSLAKAYTDSKELCRDDSYDILWDGNTEGRVTVAHPIGVNYCKVSDRVLTKEELIGATFIYPDGPIQVAEQNVADGSMFGVSTQFFGIMTDQPLPWAVSCKACVIDPDGARIVIPSDGTYFIYDSGFYMSKLAKDIIRPIDPKFLPDSVFIPNPEAAKVGQTIVVSEVDENGKPVAWEATTPSAVQLIIWEDGD